MQRFRNKKGQTAARTAILILVITAGILLYILFLPPAERAKLLEEDNNGNSDDTESSSILLLETPGRLDYLKQETFEYPLPSFNLYSTTNAALLKDFSSGYAKRSLFSEQIDKKEFTIEDLNHTQDMKLSFKKETGKGRLLIRLNGKPIYEKFVNQDYPEPIILPRESLYEGKNSLEFSVSSPGLLFFLINEYSLSDIKITAQVTDVSTLQNKQVFFIKENEKKNLDYATLSFLTNCKTKDRGNLRVYLNYQTIYEGVPECSMPTKITVGKDVVLEDENRLRFLADSGSYTIDQIRFRTYLKEPVYATYYFEISDSEYSDLNADLIDVNMSIIIVQDTKNSDTFEVEINGRKFAMYTDERVQSKLIDAYLRNGNNAITVRPLHGYLEVVELKIRTQDKD